MTAIERNFKDLLPTTIAFFDIQSVFDSAWQPIITLNLIRNKCPLYLVEKLSSFLYGRKAALKSVESSLLVDIEIGCPQGSKLSPLLWNILVEGLLRNMKFKFPHLVIAYADDLVFATRTKIFQ